MARTKTVTLAAGVAQTVTVDSWEAVEVTNMNGVAEVWVRLGTTDPVVDGDDSIGLPAAISSVILDDPDEVATATVRVISAGAAKVHVRAVSKAGLA